MNNRCYRLVFSKLRGMLVAVFETAIAQGKSGQRETGSSSEMRPITFFAVRHVVFAALTLFGLPPALSGERRLPYKAPGLLPRISTMWICFREAYKKTRLFTVIRYTHG
jgi:filamentous hemagglutinin